MPAETSPDSTSSTAGKPLSGYRVLELGRVIAAPYAAQILGDLGAEVIKVERPGAGDDSRRYGPPFVKDRDGQDTPETAIYMSANRNKKSITVDLTTSGGQEVVRQLAARSDVMLENYKFGDLARYGLDYESIRQFNPALVYCSITGYGQTGPYRQRPGYDAVFQAEGGLMGITGIGEGEAGAGPVKVGVAIVDVMCALQASNAILAALHERHASGQGQHIDVSLLDTTVASLFNVAATYELTGRVPPRSRSEGTAVIPSGIFPCRDGTMMLCVGNDQQYKKLCEVLACPELASDEKYRTNSARVHRRKEIVGLIQQRTRSWAVMELANALSDAGVPAGPVNDLAQVFKDPHVVERGMRVNIPHPRAGSLNVLAHPVRYSRTPIDSYVAPPSLGEHTDSVLAELLGLDARQIADLRSAKAI